VTDIERWADPAMFASQQRKGIEGERTGHIRPQVYLLHMNADPLGSIAAACKMYEGKVVYRLDEVTDEERRHYFRELLNTKLQAPLEFVNFHLLLEGVTRSFTHQLVRQRTAVYAQESLRFAVKENVDQNVALPPSLRELPDDDPRVVVWRRAVHKADDAYSALVSAGVPAEDARGLLPHNIVTRVHYSTNLRALLDHAGNRLCTQAQFEWRGVFAAIAQAIRQYRPVLQEGAVFDGKPLTVLSRAYDWQYALIADALRPVCYQTGKCEFKASFDRSCSIRERVDAFERAGIPSNGWHSDGWVDANRQPLNGIQPQEWLMDPGAAR
jgi:flavin-dependent thymidylate synthase